MLGRRYGLSAETLCTRKANSNDTQAQAVTMFGNPVFVTKTSQMYEEMNSQMYTGPLTLVPTLRTSKLQHRQRDFK